MKCYILFTQEEIEDMLNGREIELQLRGETLYFMCKEHFAQLADARPEEE